MSRGPQRSGNETTHSMKQLVEITHEKAKLGIRLQLRSWSDFFQTQAEQTDLECFPQQKDSIKTYNQSY